MSRREYEAEDRRVDGGAVALALALAFTGWVLVCGAVSNTLGGDVGLVLVAAPLLAGGIVTCAVAAVRGVR